MGTVSCTSPTLCLPKILLSEIWTWKSRIRILSKVEHSQEKKKISSLRINTLIWHCDCDHASGEKHESMKSGKDGENRNADWKFSSLAWRILLYNAVCVSHNKDNRCILHFSNLRSLNLPTIQVHSSWTKSLLLPMGNMHSGSGSFRFS